MPKGRCSFIASARGGNSCSNCLSRDQARLDAALQDLPEDQREVFLLRLHGDLEVPQIAALIDAPLETVKSRLRYAQQKLRRLLAEEIPA